ncbi:MAG: hypothetical protein PHO23_03420 [Candidatus Pacebacteria bacterium]|nr:hypothetical protein [Candidatus Paceibacterota bacterium]
MNKLNKKDSLFDDSMKSFKNIHPDKMWVEACKESFMGSVRQDLKSTYDFRISFLFKSFATLVIFLGITYGFSMGISSLTPTSPLYGAKEGVVNTLSKILPAEKEYANRLALVKEKVSTVKELSKSYVENEEKIIELNNSIYSDLATVNKELKEMNRITVLVSLSSEIKDIANMLNNTKTDNVIIASNMSVKETPVIINSELNSVTNDILAIVVDSENKANNCSEYLNTKISEISDPEFLKNIPPAEYNDFASLVKKATRNIEAGNCLKALELIEQIDGLKLNLLVNPSDEGIN